MILSYYIMKCSPKMQLLNKYLIQHLQHIKDKILDGDTFKSQEASKYYRSKTGHNTYPSGSIISDLLCRDDIPNNEAHEYEIEMLLIDSSIDLFDKSYRMVVAEKYNADWHLINIPYDQLLQTISLAIKFANNPAFL
jgi:hypothetical protein